MAKKEETIKIDIIENMKILMDDIYEDTYKIFLNGNYSAGKRARKNSHILKNTILEFRKIILAEMKKNK